MSNEADPSSKDKPLPLSYERPTHSSGSEYAVFAVIAGFIVGVALLGCGSAVHYVGTHPLPPGWNRSESATQAFISAGIYGLLAAAAGIGAIRTFRSPRQPKRFFLAGFLIGIAIAALVEGVCFANA